MCTYVDVQVLVSSSIPKLVAFNSKASQPTHEASLLVHTIGGI